MPSSGPPLVRSAPRWIVALAGPTLIVAAALVLMREFVLGGKVTGGDIVRYWLPMQCFLGRSLAAGHIPSWTPHVLSGTPFAADPQSGWMDLLPMLLYSTLRCGTALRWLVVLQPLLAGLGIYWFARGEGLSRSAATVGGLALAVAVSGSRLPVSIRFPGVVAWTALLLAAASRYVRAPTWSARLVWLAATALAWGQVAASQATVGSLIGTIALVAYLIARLPVEVRRGSLVSRHAILFAGLALLALPAVNLAFLLPRLAYSSHTSLAMGYGTLQKLSLELTGQASPPFPGLSTGLAWPLNFATVPGVYLGSAILGLSFAGWWSTRFRYLAAAFSAYGGLCYVLGLHLVADHIPARIASIWIVDQYLHEPYWFSFGLLISLAVLGAVGLDAWRERATAHTRLSMIGPAVVAWVILPMALGGHPERLGLLAAGAVALAAVLVAAGRVPALLAVVPSLVAIELCAGVFLGSGLLPFRPAPALLPHQFTPNVDAGAYLQPTPLARRLSGSDARYLVMASLARDRRALQNNESLLLGLPNVGGYQAVQLARYWLFVRTIAGTPMKYNYALFSDPPPVALDLLHVGWIIAPRGRAVTAAAEPVARDGRWELYRLGTVSPHASMLSDWEVAPSAGQALREVTTPGFDPGNRMVLEEEPGIPKAPGRAGRATARYRALGPQAAQVDVQSPTQAIVLVRNMWESNWRATVDGRATRILRADYLVQGIPVGAGRHTILLRYDDPTIGYGLLGSALSLGAILLVAAGLHLSRRETRDAPRSGWR